MQVEFSEDTSGCGGRAQTCDEGRHPPANQVVEPHGPIVDVSLFADHPVDVQPLQEEPGEGAQVEEVQQDGDDGAQELQRQGEADVALPASHTTS